MFSIQHVITEHVDSAQPILTAQKHELGPTAYMVKSRPQSFVLSQQAAVWLLSLCEQSFGCV